MHDHWTIAEADAETIRERLGSPLAAVVMGSGWSTVAGSLGRTTATMPMAELTGVPDPTVQGHGATASMVEVAGRDVLVLAGRSHLYEGHDVHTVVHAVRSAVLSGASTVLLTNAAGSLRPEVGVGTPVILTDQLNLTGVSPLCGPAPPGHIGGRFVDLTGMYDPDLVHAALTADQGAVTGVYAGVLGGAFETPAEVRMLATLGADLVGMSTVLEAIAARHLGAHVFGVSLVTNLAAGLQESLDHEEVLAAGSASASRLTALLSTVLSTAESGN
ncbi:MAG: purine-nucleoside phosphorylase [Microthrixaceae bacterium]|nr:purine-nucleoside phosphorylase [Microthrixaceae bacterium]